MHPILCEAWQGFGSGCWRRLAQVGPKKHPWGSVYPGRLSGIVSRQSARFAASGAVPPRQSNLREQALKLHVADPQGPAAALLLGPRLEGGTPRDATVGVGTCCLYFACVPAFLCGWTSAIFSAPAKL